MSRRLLMVAYHFPPFAGSSGFLRTVSFARYLPEHGWRPIVLSTHTRAYTEVAPENLKELPARLEVHRAFALDVARHLSIRGAYPRWLATPDRWNTWLLGAVPKILSLIRRERPQAMWTTYPISSAVLIGLVVHRLTGIPWVVDLRDPLVYDAWPSDPWMRRVYSCLEKLAVHGASKVVVTTPGALRIYRERYPRVPETRWQIIANGVDDSILATVQANVQPAPARARPIHLVHGGLLEVPDRDPAVFFQALADLQRRGCISPASLRVTLRASGQELRYQQLIDELGIGSIVTLAPRVSYREALAEMIAADGLLLFQGAPCNNQIPAKAYEYLVSGKPILGLVDSQGDTCSLLRESSVPYLANLDAPNEIAEALPRLLADIESGTAWRPGADLAARYSRRARSEELAAVLDEVSGTVAR